MTKFPFSGTIRYLLRKGISVMGLFSSKGDKEIIKQLSMQIEKQQESVVKLSRENEELRKQCDLAEKSKHIETEKLFKEKEKLENDIKKLNELQYNSNKTRMQFVTINGNEKGNLIECGIYKSGEDFTPGKYDFYAIEGKGDISCSKGDIWELMSEEPEGNYIKKYRNMYIPNGSKVEINGNLKLLMYHSMPIEPKFREGNDESVISTGQYKIGEDIPAGKYIIELKSGKGIIDDSDEICVEFEKCEITRARVILKKGKILTVDGNLEVYIYESKPIQITKKERDINNNSVLCGGVYDAGIDIPYGYYDIMLVNAHVW